MDAFALLTITVLAVFLGFEVVSKVSSTLHTPLMSEANAIHGIILLGAIMVAGQASDPVTLALSLLAVLLATINIVGGFVVTDRMLLMFASKPRRAAPKARQVVRLLDDERRPALLPRGRRAVHPRPEGAELAAELAAPTCSGRPVR